MVSLRFTAAAILLSFTALAQEGARDYIYPEEMAPAARKQDSRNYAISTTGQSVSYRSFLDSQIHVLTEYTGVYTSWLLDSTWVNGLTVDQIRDLVDRTDLLYNQYHQLLGAEPLGAGTLRIAVVPATCGVGCGVVGSRGIELRSDMLNTIRENLLENKLPSVVVHEMAHNYDIFDRYISYVPDPGHAWTSFMEPYMAYYTGMGWQDEPPSEALRRGLDATFLAWIRTPGVTWQTCVRDNGCAALGIGSRESWAGIWLWYAKVHGTAALMRAFQYLREQSAPGVNPPSGAENKENLRLQALKAGLNGADLDCVFTEWKWKTLTPAGLCKTVLPARDADADGFSTLAGDLLDQTAGAGSPLDNDGGGSSDANGDLIPGNTLVYEAAGGDFTSPTTTVYPVSLHGLASTGSDVEMFRIPIAATGKMRVALRFLPATSAQSNAFTFFFSKPTGGSLQHAYTYPANYASISFSFVVDVTPGQWTLTFTPPQGGYTLSFFPAQADAPEPWASTATPARTGAAYRLTSSTVNLGGAAPVKVRYWVSGVGLAGDVAYAANTSFDWTPASGLTPGTYGYRVQGVDASGTGLTNYSAARWFTVSSSTEPPPPPPPPSTQPDVASLSPLSGSGTSVTATAVFRHPGGQAQHYLGYILFLPLPNVVSFNAQGTCLIEFNRLGGNFDGKGGMRLINNAGNNWLGRLVGEPLAPSTTSLSNNACTVNVAGATVAFSGTDMTVTVPVTFNPALVSQTMGTFIQSNDVTGVWTDFRQFGNWTVPGAPVRSGPFVTSATPTSGAGANTTLTITAGHSVGFFNLGELHIRFASSIVGSTSCHIIYSPAVNVMSMINDAGTALIGPVPIGQPLSTNRCSVPAGATRFFSPTTLTLNLPVNFNPGSFGGPKNVYLNGFDITGAVTHWVQTGSWTVQ